MSIIVVSVINVYKIYSYLCSLCMCLKLFNIEYVLVEFVLFLADNNHKLVNFDLAICCVFFRWLYMSHLWILFIQLTLVMDYILHDFHWLKMFRLHCNLYTRENNTWTSVNNYKILSHLLSITIVKNSRK